MSEEEKQIMNKMIYCNLVNGEQALKFNSHIKEILQENEQLKNQLQQKENILKEVREYITSYEAISTIQGLEDIEANKDLDEKTLNEMVRRYMIVHDKLLEILDKGSDKE